MVVMFLYGLGVVLYGLMVVMLCCMSNVVMAVWSNGSYVVLCCMV